MDWKLKRKEKALRFAMIRAENCPGQTATLEKRIMEANQYLAKLKKKQNKEWFK